MGLFSRLRGGMRIKLRFFGAARSVTGSRFCVEVNGLRVLIDCGLYQERELRDRNWEKFPVSPGDIDAVLLTHAHLDHCGLLPKLVKEGFRGRIHCTAATAEIARIILLDSAHIQEEDAEHKRKRHEREGRKGAHPDVPLYTTADADAVTPLFSPVDYGEPVDLGAGVTAKFCDAGHVFGSSTITLTAQTDGQTRRILFSGDVGRKDKPILDDPDAAGEADYVLVESTYGDRVHEPTENVEGQLAEIINTAVEAGGNIVIPSFALERSQELLYHLNELLIADRIPHLVTFLDSPMAIRITKVFDEHPELFDEEMARRMKAEMSPFDFPGLKMTMSTAESKAINRIKGSAVIIAGSGMCTGGRIKHHLVQNISRPECTVLFVGYQAEGTLGRHIVAGSREVRIHGEKRQVLARVEQVHGFSAHADRDELVSWLSGLKSPPRQVFVVHGEEAAALAFRDYLTDKTGWPASAPNYLDEVTLD